MYHLQLIAWVLISSVGEQLAGLLEQEVGVAVDLQKLNLDLI